MIATKKFEGRKITMKMSEKLLLRIEQLAVEKEELHTTNEYLRDQIRILEEEQTKSYVNYHKEIQGLNSRISDLQAQLNLKNQALESMNVYPSKMAPEEMEKSSRNYRS